MKITDLKVAVIGRNPVVRILTDEGIVGYGAAETAKADLKPHILYYRNAILGQDPTDVERVMLRIRRKGSFKPWGSAVSAIEVALWDIAGKALGAPIYKLLGGKVRDKVRVYNGNVRFPMQGSYRPEDFAANMQKMKDAPQGFSLIKQGLAFHGDMLSRMPEFGYGCARTCDLGHRYPRARSCLGSRADVSGHSHGSETRGWTGRVRRCRS